MIVALNEMVLRRSCSNNFSRQSLFSVWKKKTHSLSGNSVDVRNVCKGHLFPWKKKHICFIRVQLTKERNFFYKNLIFLVDVTFVAKASRVLWFLRPLYRTQYTLMLIKVFLRPRNPCKRRDNQWNHGYCTQVDFGHFTRVEEQVTSKQRLSWAEPSREVSKMKLSWQSTRWKNFERAASIETACML